MRVNGFNGLVNERAGLLKKVICAAALACAFAVGAAYMPTYAHADSLSLATQDTATANYSETLKAAMNEFGINENSIMYYYETIRLRAA